MFGTHLAAVLAAALTVAAMGGCDGAAGRGEVTGRANPEPLAAVDRARAALLTSAETPVPPPSDTVEIQAPFAAQGDQVSAPWPQFQICSTVAKADEGPPSVVEPGAVAAAWAFGSAFTTAQEGPGYSQIDQYAIVYEDQGAAIAAVDRARDLDCDEAIRAWAQSGLRWAVELGPVPEEVSGFRTTATFTIPSQHSTRTAVSSVMRRGEVVHYMRFSESRGSGRDGVLDAGFTEDLLAAAAANLRADAQ